MDLMDIRKIIENDLETKDLKVNDNDLLTVYRYIVLRDSSDDGYKPKLKTDPYIEIIYAPTKEQQEKIMINKNTRNLNFFNGDIYIQDNARLDHFSISSKEREKAFNTSKKIIEDFETNGTFKGLYIYGKYSTGKTYLLSAIANELSKRGLRVLFAFMPDLVRNIKTGMSERDLESRVNILKRTDVLMLDDIGGENMTPWFRDEILLPVIQYRLSGKLPVFFTSNLTMEELVEALSTSKTNVDYVKSVRLIQRIRDLTTYLQLNAEQFKK